jgi:hypothetical protein
MMTDIVTLSPSDLTFLWSQCPRCFYLKYIHKISRPSAPFPSIFSKIDLLMKGYFADQSASSLNPALPPGIISFADRWVVSQPLELAGHTLRCQLRGKFDSVIAFEDGSYGVVDFKTTDPRPSHIAFYRPQLHAYALALEQPAPGALLLSPISRLGLFSVAPSGLEGLPDGRLAYTGVVTWQEIPRDDTAFLKFLGKVLTLLELPEPPPPGETCGYCQYREGARQHLF